MAGGKFTYVIDVDAKGAATLKTMTRESEKLDTAVKQSAKGLGGLQENFVATAAAAAGFYYAISGGVRWMGESVRMAGEAEAIQRKLEFAYGASAATLASQASALQLATGYGDEAIKSAQERLSYYGVEAAGAHLATTAIADMAAALRMDLGTAADLVGKAVSGNVSLLGRYGVVLSDTEKAAFDAATESERLAKMVDLLNDRFGGRSTIEGHEKSVRVLSESYGDLREELGFLVTTGDETTASMDSLSGTLVNLTTILNTNRDAVQSAVSWFAKWAGPLSVVYRYNALIIEQVAKLQGGGVKGATASSKLVQEVMAQNLSGDLAKNRTGKTPRTGGGAGAGSASQSVIISPADMAALDMLAQRAAQLEGSARIFGDIQAQGAELTGLLDYQWEQRRMLDVEAENSARREAQARLESQQKVFDVSMQYANILASSTANYIAEAAVEGKADFEAMWKGALKGAIAMTAQMLIQLALAKAIQAALGGAVGGPVGAVAGAFFHTGGMVARRAHSGIYTGGGGLGPDEVPIIAQKREAVLNRRATRNIGGKAGVDALNSGGSIGGSSYNITINAAPGMDVESLSNAVIKKIKRESDRGIGIVGRRGLR